MKFDGRMYRAASLFTSKEEPRAYLAGVYVQPHPAGGALLVGTDGHRMFVAHDVEGEVQKSAIVVLERAALDEIRKSKAADVVVAVDNGGVASIGAYRGTESCIVAKEFPDWWKVPLSVLDLARRRFYGKPVFGLASFNGEYLWSFAKAALCLRPDRPRSIRPVIFGECEPALILYPEEPDVFGVLMPMKTTDLGPALPAFMKPILEPRGRRRSAKLQ